MDETMALPSEKAAEIALRTQQLIAYESGVANVIDPLGGSWYIEELTDKMEEKANKYFKKIEELGGVIPAIEMGYFQREIAEAASEFQRRVDNKRRIIVGVNEFIKDSNDIDIPILEISEEVQNEQISSLNQIKVERNSDLVNNKLSLITTAASNGDNLIPLIIDAAKSYCTLGEIVDSMKIVFGEWRETAVI